MPKVKRYFLEIKKENLKLEKAVLPSGIEIILDKNKDININKFFYRQIGKDHFWRDRLLWSDKEWERYIKNPNLITGIMKKNDDLVGFYEQEHHSSSFEVELIQMGILKEYQGKNLGSMLLKHIISQAFNEKIKRLWVHTCTLDHKNALRNYLSRGFKVFREEEINFSY
jgi:GNAT superfamily N-acetyltransferase